MSKILIKKQKSPHRYENNVAYHRVCRGRRPGPLGGPAAAPTAPSRGLLLLLLLLAPLHISTLQKNNRLKEKKIFLKLFNCYIFAKSLTLGKSQDYYLPLGTCTLSPAEITG